MPAPQTPADPHRLPGIVVCRRGLEPVVEAELRELGIEVAAVRNRAIDIVTSLGGFYRANMGLRSALNVLRPIRTFNARTYDLLYYQSRKTNWHKLFPVDASLRIDVKGHSSTLNDAQYAIHRVRDGIVDTFRKLQGGRRPSVEKRAPEVHIVVYFHEQEASLALDTSGVPLFKRGYRGEHGEAPIKEDLAAGILALSGWDRKSPLLDPMCGSGTFLFEAWMMAAGIAPNLQRRFGFEKLLNYDPDLHRRERKRLVDGQRPAPEGLDLLGIEIDEPTFCTLSEIRKKSFPGAPIRVEAADFRRFDPGPRFRTLVCNPPYGVRIGEKDSISPLYRELGNFLGRHLGGGRAGIYTANHEAAREFGGEVQRSIPLRNGSLDGRLYLLEVAGSAGSPATAPSSSA